MDKADLLGNILPVKDFDIYNKNGEKVFDGSKILGIIADKSWFRIKPQDMYMDDFKNANNRSWNYYLNNIKMYNYSFFANAVIFATEAPSIAVTELKFKNNNPQLKVGEKIILELDITPANGTTSVEFTSGTTANATVRKIDNRHVEVTGVANGVSVITATAGNVSTNVTATVSDVHIVSMAFDEQAPEIQLGASENLHLILNPTNASTSVTFSSSDTDVATVEKVSNKVVTVSALSAGTTTITATAENGAVTATVTVTVPAGE